MKIQSLFIVSIIFFWSAIAFTEQAAAVEPSAAVTGLCKDGSSYTGATKKGACRGHKGIKEWYADKQAPVAAETASTAKEPALPASGAATGLCKDGTEYTGASKKGACRGHKGVKEWYADKSAADAPPSAPSEAAPAKAVSAAPAQSVATGLCKDGTEYTGASKRGACRGHKGVKEWYADKQAPTAVEAAPPAPAPAVAAPATAAPAAVPEAKPASTQPAAPVAGGAGKVWVNTRSKIYHCEGSKFYGKTKEGEYMTEAEAQAKGNVANRKKTCN